jgi:NADH:ubiquinone reductase (H+-translocating)
MTASEDDHHIVIIGAGFGGLEAARNLAKGDVRITVIDRRNHHLFQPLLYQVATASLATSEIAWPIRSLLSRFQNVTTLLGTVTGVDTEAKTVSLDDTRAIAYDTLIIATGARHAYFGNDAWEPYAPGLKTLEDATTIRRRILAAFEQAEWEPDAAEPARPASSLPVRSRSSPTRRCAATSATSIRGRRVSCSSRPAHASWRVSPRTCRPMRKVR